MDHDLNSLAAFADGRLDAAERQQVIDHLAECPECRVVVARYARGMSLDAREAAPVRTPSSRAVWSWLPVAAALVLATTAAILVVRISPPGTITAPAVEPPRPADPGDVVTPQAGQPPAVDRSVPGETKGETAPDIDRRRSGERRVGEKVFRLEAGHWIDTSFDVAALMPEVRVTTAAGRKELLDRLPALGPFADLGPHVTVVHEGTVYVFSVD